MTETLFAKQDPAGNDFDPNKNYLTELVGEGKKFKSPEDLAKGKAEADHFIETLKRQQDELRADYLKLREEANTRAKLEELVGQLEARQNNNTFNEPPKNDVKPVDLESVKAEMKSMFKQELTSYEQQKVEAANFRSVQEKLLETYGPSYDTVLKTKIEELGLTQDYVNDMARRAPKALLRSLGADQQTVRESLTAPPRSTVRSDNFQPTGTEKRTWAWYQKLKATDPKKYYNPQTNVQMHNDMIALGESFKDGDFHRFGD